MSTKKIATTDFAVGQPSDIILAPGVSMGGGSIEPVAPDALNDGYAERLAFMEEPLVIIVQESGDENAENPVVVGVNGETVAFFRGKPTRAKRKFVDALIVKSSRVTTPKVRNGAGEDAYAIRQSSAHKFPFMVEDDPSPKGREWLSRRLADII